MRNNSEKKLRFYPERDVYLELLKAIVEKDLETIKILPLSHNHFNYLMRINPSKLTRQDEEFPQSFFYFACAHGSPEIIRYMLEEHPNRKLKAANLHEDRFLHSCLVNALFHNRLDIAEVLIQAGVNINEEREGKTALHMLVSFFDRTEYTEFLMQNQANPLLKDRDGKTAADLAIEMKKIRQFQCILNYTKPEEREELLSKENFRKNKSLLKTLEEMNSALQKLPLDHRIKEGMNSYSPSANL